MRYTSIDRGGLDENGRDTLDDDYKEYLFDRFSTPRDLIVKKGARVMLTMVSVSLTQLSVSRTK